MSCWAVSAGRACSDTATRIDSLSPAVYTANESARAALENRLTALTGGYVALVGQAGSGKSTLLASMNVPGRVVRYYAFIPDAPDPLSGRGEADSFLHDLYACA